MRNSAHAVESTLRSQGQLCLVLIPLVLFIRVLVVPATSG